LFGSQIGTVRGVGGHIAEKGGLLAGALPHPGQGRGEEDVGAKTLRPDKAPIMAHDGIRVAVVRRVGARAVIGLANAPATVDEDLVQDAAFRLIVGLVPEMSLPKAPGGVTRRL